MADDNVLISSALTLKRVRSRLKATCSACLCSNPWIDSISETLSDLLSRCIRRLYIRIGSSKQKTIPSSSSSLKTSTGTGSNFPNILGTKKWPSKMNLGPDLDRICLAASTNKSWFFETLATDLVCVFTAFESSDFIKLLAVKCGKDITWETVTQELVFPTPWTPPINTMPILFFD